MHSFTKRGLWKRSRRALALPRGAAYPLAAFLCISSTLAGFQARAQAEEAGGMIVQLQEEVQAVRQENVKLLERLTLLEAEIANLRQMAVPAIPRLPGAVEICGQRVPLEKWGVRERLEREFYLMLGDESQVILWMKRSARYFPFIEEQVRKAGLPSDLKYVAVAESSLIPTAYSRAGASGLWQFIGSTGQRYDLRLTSYIDERRDVAKATEAAFRYLSDLYEEFQDWPLAMAAYNAGEKRVAEAIEVQGVDSYYDLSLPIETERYVFRIIAAKIILSEPDRYGFVFNEDDLYPPLDYEEVQVEVKGSRLTLRAVAEAIGVSRRQLRDWNPFLRVDYLPSGRYHLRVPRGVGSTLMATLESWGEEGGPSRRVVHRVSKGETLWSIADRYGVRLASLREWNSLRGSIIYPGDMLTVYAPIR